MNRPASRDNPFAPRVHGVLETVTPRVLLWRSIVNSTVFVGDSCCAVVDTQVNPASARRLASAIAQATGKPLRYAINTHYHWDHCAGNAVFAAQGATLVASRRTAQALIDRQPRQRAFLSSRGFELGDDPPQPGLFSDDAAVLDLGGLTLELRPGRRAETADPTLVWCPQERVLAAGDTVMTGSFPIFGQPSQREGLEDDAWLHALDEVRGFGALHVCPGHGPLAHESELATLERICRHFLDAVRRHHAAGDDLGATIAAIEDELPAWIGKIPEVWGTPRYAILRVWAGLADLGQPGWQHVKPPAIPTVSVSETERLAERAEAAGEGGDHALALGYARAAAAASPHDADAQVLLARLLIQASRSIASVLEKGDCFHEAQQALTRALELRPGHPAALIQRGQFRVMMAFRGGEDPAPGEADLEAAAAANGLTPRQRSEIAFYQGIAARARGDESTARAGFLTAQAADPRFMPATLALLA